VHVAPFLHGRSLQGMNAVFVKIYIYDTDKSIQSMHVTPICHTKHKHKRKNTRVNSTAGTPKLSANGLPQIHVSR